MQKVIFILLGGAFATEFRYALSTLVYSPIKQPKVAYANFLINGSGGFLIGRFVESFNIRLLISPTAWVAILTAVLGGYTTFSSFSFATDCLIRDGQMWLGISNALGSLLLGLVALGLGGRWRPLMSRGKIACPTASADSISASRLNKLAVSSIFVTMSGQTSVLFLSEIA